MLMMKCRPGQNSMAIAIESSELLAQMTIETQSLSVRFLIAACTQLFLLTLTLYLRASTCYPSHHRTYGAERRRAPRG